MPGQKPEIPKAWELLEPFVRVTPANRRPFHTFMAQMLVAMALVRADLPDSARAVALRSRGNVTIDPTHDLAYYEAQVRGLYWETGTRRSGSWVYYLAANPQRRDGLARDETWTDAEPSQRSAICHSIRETGRELDCARLPARNHW